MDDGSTAFGSSNYMRNTPVFLFCTDSFSKASCENIVEWFYKKHNIKARLRPKKLKNYIGYRVLINNESSRDFVALIEHHTLKCFNYKINCREYLIKRNLPIDA